MKDKIVIGLIIKDAKQYVYEWLAWYRMLGFKNFYVADNDSTDGTYELLKDLADRGFITLTQQPTLETKTQLFCYNNFVRNAYLEGFTHIAFIDIDEFLFKDILTPNWNTHKDLIYEIITMLSRKNVGSVSIPCRVYGTSGFLDKTDELVTSKYSKCTTNIKFGVNRLVKSFVLIEAIHQVGVHACILKEGYIYLDNSGNPAVFDKTNKSMLSNYVHNGLYVNHYITKSVEDFKERKSRGCAMFGKHRHKTLPFLERVDKESTETHVLNTYVLEFLQKEINLLMK